MSEQLKNKILNMEVAPPATAWDFIAARLDEQATNGTAGVQLKMNQLEVAPPAFIWNEIEKELDKNAEKVVPFRSRNTKRLLYAVAAALVGVIGYNVVNYYLNSNATTVFSSPESVTIAGNNQDQSPDTSNPVVSNNNQSSDSNTNISSLPSNTTNRLPLETNDYDNKEVYADNDVSLQRADAEPVSYADLYNPDEGVHLVAHDLNGNIPSGINAVTASNNYFITTGPNGEVVRVSNKLANIIQMLGDDASTEENINVIIKESAIWKQRFYNLRNKLSKLAPSPNNFMDIIELANALKEEKKP
ncbi:MAG: hypothetical protein HYR66_03235 [Sphingobacteriales bacterium]|nr:hypothetical protein [Sphingobacteriales bacterium]MBI3720728.1 hypothetical protein [Sphingobacteriales bacterium]